MENDETLKTYNRSAKQLAEYFRGIGPREEYISGFLTNAGFEIRKITSYD